MSSQPVKPSKPRRLILVVIIALVAAAAIAPNGLINRSRSKQDLMQWTAAQAPPTVALAKLARGDAEQRLILPGDIQPYNKAAIYARVSGYLKSWEQDIGASVTAGPGLAFNEGHELRQKH